MSFTIVHLLPKQAPNGAYTMLCELRYALAKHYPDIVQKVIISGEPRENPRFQLEREYVVTGRMLPYLNSLNNPIVFFHKLMATETDVYAELIMQKCPFVIINHTFSPKIKNIKKCNLLVSVSEHMKIHFKKVFPKLKHVCIRNGVNQEQYTNILPRASNGELRYFLTGRINAINEHKHHHSFIDWISNANLPKRMVLEYIGDGNQIKPAKKQASRLRQSGSPNYVNFLGPIYNFNRKVSILKSWHLFVYEINRHEGTSMSILESLACGVPVVCSNHHGNKDIISQGVNGYVYSSIDEATKILSELMNEPDRLKELKASTLKHFADNLDAKVMADKYVEISKQLLGE